VYLTIQSSLRLTSHCIVLYPQAKEKSDQKEEQKSIPKSNEVNINRSKSEDNNDEEAALKVDFVDEDGGRTSQLKSPATLVKSVKGAHFLNKKRSINENPSIFLLLQ
jgi:hypothetical protein